MRPKGFLQKKKKKKKRDKKRKKASVEFLGKEDPSCRGTHESCVLPLTPKRAAASEKERKLKQGEGDRRRKWELK